MYEFIKVYDSKSQSTKHTELETYRAIKILAFIHDIINFELFV